MGVRPFAHRSHNVVRRNFVLTALLSAVIGATSLVAQSTTPPVQNALRLVVVNDQDVPVPMADVLCNSDNGARGDAPTAVECFASKA